MTSLLQFFEAIVWTSPTVSIKMVAEFCRVCEESVSARCSAVECEVCERWVHTACVGLKASTKMLSHKNIMFLCDECLVEAGSEEGGLGAQDHADLRLEHPD